MSVKKRNYLENRLSRKGIKPNPLLIYRMASIQNQDDFDAFVKYLEEFNLGNDFEYEYYNAAYRILYGEESDAYTDKESDE